MAYPSTIDSPTTNVDNVDVIYAADVNNLQTAVVALETKVGVDSSAVTSSHDYKLSEVTDKAVGKTATQTLTNKTLTSPTITTPAINGTPTGTFVVPVANGGTGQTTANAGLNALIPSQTGNSGKYLGTDGSNTSWSSAANLPDTQSYLAAANVTIGQPLHYTAYGQLGNEIKFDSHNSVQSSGTVSLTVGNNSDRLLIVDIQTPNGTTVTGITYAGVSMTLIDSQIIPSALNNHYSYKLIAPTVGTANVVATISGSSSGMGLIATSYYNVDQTTPIEATTKVTSSAGGTLTQAISTVSQCAMVHVGGATNASTGATTISFDSISGSNLVSLSSTLSSGKANSPVSESARSVSVAYTQASTHRGIIILVIKPSQSAITGVVPASSLTSTVFTETKDRFIGFANQTVTGNNTVSVDVGGVTPNQTSLSIGRYYYIQDTAGTIGISPGTVNHIVAKAVSSTSVVIIQS